MPCKRLFGFQMLDKNQPVSVKVNGSDGLTPTIPITSEFR